MNFERTVDPSGLPGDTQNHVQTQKRSNDLRDVRYLPTFPRFERTPFPCFPPTIISHRLDCRVDLAKFEIQLGLRPVTSHRTSP